MGIKHFFKDFKNRFSSSIITIKNETFKELGTQDIDNLLLDMNGIFHSSAQKIYKYGNHKSPKSFFNKKHTSSAPAGVLQKRMFRDITQEIENLVNIVKPKKRLLICIDGTAPLSKQSQQRSRRFMSAMNKEEDRNFDSNSITPGTKMMDFLSKYIDWYIRNQISNDNPNWKHLEVIFSNEKCPSEGEHKLLSYVRKYGTNEEVYCICGMDADLIMLALASHKPNFFILREEPKSRDFSFYVIDIGSVRKELISTLLWESKEYQFDHEKAINDFIFMCFTVGNDFLPHIPGIEILHGGIDTMVNVYKKVGEGYGHLTSVQENGSIRFRRKSLMIFLGTIGKYEQQILEEKLNERQKFFPSPMLESCSSLQERKFVLDMKSYKKVYYETNFCDDEKKICHIYLEGMQWVLDYYTKGVPNWRWRYKYHYAPFSSSLSKYIGSFLFPTYPESSPTLPFIQLLSVLPPDSANLIPSPLSDILLLDTSPMKQFCPTDFKVDLSGCKAEWEGVVILPMVDYELVEKLYLEKIKSVDEKERKRNIIGKSFSYKKSTKKYLFTSYYGDINCSVDIVPIEI